MKKLIVFCLLVSLIFVQCYTPSEFVRDQKIMVLNNSMKSITNSQSLKPIGLCNVKKSTVNYFSTDGCERKSKVDHEVIFGILIGGGLGYLVAPKYKFFNNSVGPGGLKYILGGAIIGGIIGYIISEDD